MLKNSFSIKIKNPGVLEDGGQNAFDIISNTTYHIPVPC